MLRHFRKMTPFSMVDIPIPFPPKSMLNFGPSSLFFFFYSDNIDSVGGGGGVRGFMAFKRNEIINELNVC